MSDSQVTVDITLIISAGKSPTFVTKIKYFILLIWQVKPDLTPTGFSCNFTDKIP